MFTHHSNDYKLKVIKDSANLKCIMALFFY